MNTAIIPGQKRQEIFAAIKELGECTSAEAHRKRGLNDAQIASESRGRITELRDAGFIVEGTERVCGVTGKVAKTFRVAEALPGEWRIAKRIKVEPEAAQLTLALPLLGAMIPEGRTKEENDAEIKAGADQIRANLWRIGDAANYGQKKFGQTLEEQAELAGMDAKKLHSIALTCEAVPLSRRRASLDFEHHHAVARLAPEMQDQWLFTAEVEGIKSVRRLKKSILLGRPAAEEELQSDPSDGAQQSVIGHVNSIRAICRRYDIENMEDGDKLFRLHRELMDVCEIHARVLRRMNKVPTSAAQREMIQEDLRKLA